MCQPDCRADRRICRQSDDHGHGGRGTPRSSHFRAGFTAPAGLEKCGEAYSVALGVDTHEPSLLQLKNAGVDARVCDMRHLPFDDASFDWVLMANSLHHTPNPKHAVREAARVARHGMVVCEPWWD
ncbi:class I SAM-dependent methyltransferase [Paraburkholderia strydomiana]|uniref:class I SAM-dependent methyltransferase n=1 Tax=Paraburkholderia strydomiana TaxID=1245417 RepID=UPI00286C70B6|nr:class I SAM-dependent methyltransferase [Paraburkholderia strydomiana]